MLRQKFKNLFTKDKRYGIIKILTNFLITVPLSFKIVYAHQIVHRTRSNMVNKCIIVHQDGSQGSSNIDFAISKYSPVPLRLNKGHFMQ